MSDDTFATYVERERDRLHAEREQIFNQQHELETRLADLNREFAAIDAYESAKTGKPARQATRTTTGRKGSKREQLLQVIRAGGGLKRSEILERMGLKGDKSGEMSVSNALTALTKANQVTRLDGRYHAA